MNIFQQRKKLRENIEVQCQIYTTHHFSFSFSLLEYSKGGYSRGLRIVRWLMDDFPVESFYLFISAVDYSPSLDWEEKAVSELLKRIPFKHLGEYQHGVPSSKTIIMAKSYLLDIVIFLKIVAVVKNRKWRQVYLSEGDTEQEEVTFKVIFNNQSLLILVLTINHF